MLYGNKEYRDCYKYCYRRLKSIKLKHSAKLIDTGEIRDLVQVIATEEWKAVSKEKHYDDKVNDGLRRIIFYRNLKKFLVRYYRANPAFFFMLEPYNGFSTLDRIMKANFNDAVKLIEQIKCIQILPSKKNKAPKKEVVTIGDYEKWLNQMGVG